MGFILNILGHRDKMNKIEGMKTQLNFSNFAIDIQRKWLLLGPQIPHTVLLATVSYSLCLWA